jgi:hypothetical protein
MPPVLLLNPDCFFRYMTIFALDPTFHWITIFALSDPLPYSPSTTITPLSRKTSSVQQRLLKSDASVFFVESRFHFR